MGPYTAGCIRPAQLFADFIKFVAKEIVVPAVAERSLFLLAPLLTFSFTFITWAVIPVAPRWVISYINFGILYIFVIFFISALAETRPVANPQLNFLL